MKASELRIGNLVWLKAHHEPVTIEEIWKEFNDEYYISTDLHEGELLSLYGPIPLDEEWMLKFGFEKLPELNYKRGVLSIELWPIDMMLTQTTKAKGLIKVGDFLLMDYTIRYVHQLQNLYHTLTGEELTIK